MAKSADETRWYLDSLTNHFRKFDEMVTSIRACGCKLKPEDVIDQLLMSMPENYAMPVEILESMKSQSISTARTKLLNRENKLKQRQSENEPRCDRVATIADEKDGRARSDKMMEIQRVKRRNRSLVTIAMAMAISRNIVRVRNLNVRLETVLIRRKVPSVIS